MIDVFVIAVLSALVRMGGLMSIYPAMGALMFALVVIMTMFSAMTFDPRLSWDRQPESEHEESLTVWNLIMGSQNPESEELVSRVDISYRHGAHWGLGSFLSLQPSGDRK